MSNIFNPVLLLYLNPELVAYSNIISVEQARDFYDQTGASNLWYTLDPIPPGFDDGVFISDNKNDINISSLNNVIKQSLLVDGEDPNEVERNGRYMTTIYRDAYLRGVNTFQYNIPGDLSTYFITPSNLNVGDYVRIIKNNVEFHTGVVDSIVDNQTFVLSNDRYAFNDSNASYTVQGIKLYDPLRLARITFLRMFAAMSNTPTPNFVNVDPTFNYELYQMLYPDARLLDRDAAFVDYMNRYNNEDIRIARTTDLNADSNITNNFQTLSVSHRLELNITQPTGRVIWGDIHLYYATSNDTRRAAAIPPYYDGIITERAIKTYVDRSYLETANFNNINVSGNANFYGFTSFTGPSNYFTYADVEHLRVLSNAIFEGTFALSNDTTMYGTTTFEGPIVGNSIINLHGAVTISNAPITVAAPMDTYDVITTHAPINLSNIVTCFDTFAATSDSVFSGSQTLFTGTGQTTFSNEVIISAPSTIYEPATFMNSLISTSNAHFTGEVSFDNTVTFTSNIIATGQTQLSHALIDNMSFKEGTVSNLAVDVLTVTEQNTLTEYTQNSYTYNAFTSNLYSQFIVNESYISVSNMSQSVSASNIGTEFLFVTNTLNAYNSELNYTTSCNLTAHYIEADTTTVNGVATFCNDADFLQNVSVGGIVYGSTVGIGDLLTIEPPAFHALSNVSVDNMVINDTLSVNSMMEVGNNMTTESTIVRVNGILEAVNIDFTSDQRLKKNVLSVDPDTILDKLTNITPCSYEYKHKHYGQRKHGIMAQDVERQFPDAIKISKDYRLPILREAIVSQKNHILLEKHDFDLHDTLEISYAIPPSSSLHTPCNDYNIRNHVKAKITYIISDHEFIIDTGLPVDICTVQNICYDEVKLIDYTQLITLLLAAVQALAAK
jgi:hypothetical protein